MTVQRQIARSYMSLCNLMLFVWSLGKNEPWHQSTFAFL